MNADRATGSDATASTTHSSRRTFLARAAVASALPLAAGLLGAGEAQASGALPDYAPIPEASKGPALNDRGYFVGRIDGDLYWVTDSSYQAMFLTTRQGVVLVDAPPTIGHNLLRAIEEVTRANGRPRKVTHLVYSHSHADHIGAASIFGRDVVRIGHTETARLLRRDADPNRPAPTLTFDDHHVLQVGGERLELAYHGPNHSPDNIFVYAPRQETLMVVDVLYPGWVPFKNLAVSQDIPGWLRAHGIAMRYPWRTLVGGHLGRLGARADGHLQQRYLADLQTSVRDTVSSLDPAPFFGKYGPAGNSWAVFAAYLNAVAEQAAAPVIADYLGILAAADVFTKDNAFGLLESLRIDAGLLGPFGIRP
ncbi:MBL fold metallo-hydrolase [Microbispora amethystogenes]|uniref:MBL fold metallo-hydrolase n=1 Tax=Microbispora amethystogenes TaxID=1427754 RepID=UPI0033FF99F1